MMSRMLLCVCGYLVFGVCFATADDGCAVLKMERKKWSKGFLHGMDVFVNGEKIGSLQSGESKELKFVPRRDGKNVLYVVVNSPIEGRTRDYEMGANPGWVLNAIVDLKSKNLLLSELEIELSTLAAPEPGKSAPIPNLDLPKNMKLISVKCDREMKSKVVRTSPVYNLPLKQEKVVEDTVTVAHSVTVTAGWNLEGELKAGWLPIEASIRAGINKSTGRSYGVESKKTRSVKVIGDGRPVRVVWSELYVTGKATVEVSGKRVEIPFEFREDFDLLLEAVSGAGR